MSLILDLNDDKSDGNSDEGKSDGNISDGNNENSSEGSGDSSSDENSNKNSEKTSRKKRQVKIRANTQKNNNATKKKKKPEPTKLKRSNAANSRLGLSVLLYPDTDNYGNATMNNYEGFKVLVHSPYEFAEVAAKGFVIDTQMETFIAGKYKTLL